MTKYQELKQTLKSSPKRWLVTGAAGFIGSNLVEELLRLNQEVIGLDNLSTGFKENLSAVQELVSTEQFQRFKFVEADISESSICEGACQGVDFVLHQAALGSVPRSIEDPINTHLANATGTLNILVAAKEAEVEGFVYASSSSVYGDHPALPKTEANVGTVLSPYAATKQFCEIYADVFSKTYDFNTIGLRYFNVFGRRQDPDGAYAAVIPKWVAAMLRGDEVFINGDGETSRDFCYIDNVVQANLLSATASREAKNQVYNVAYGNRTTLNELFEAIKERLEKKVPSLKIPAPIYRDFRPGDVRHSLANVENASKFLGYVPTHNLQNGLDLALEYYVGLEQLSLLNEHN